jgi:hypothetical protein
VNPAGLALVRTLWAGGEYVPVATLRSYVPCLFCLSPGLAGILMHRGESRGKGESSVDLSRITP